MQNEHSAPMPALDGHDQLLTRLRRLFALALGAVAAVAIAAAALYVARENSGQWVLHGRNVGRLAREARALATDRETALRGYLLTGDPASLRPDLGARVRLPVVLDSLVTLTADNPTQQLRARAMRRALDRWDRDYAQTTLTATGIESSRPTENETRARELDGKNLFDTFRARTSMFLTVEDSLYAERVRRDHGGDVASLVVMLGAMLSVAAVLRWMYARIRGQALNLLSQQDMLEEQAVELEESTAEIEASNVELQEAATELEISSDEAMTHARDADEARVHAELARGELITMLERITDAFVSVDRAFRVIYANQAAAQIDGRAPAELVGQTLWELWPASVGTELERQFRRALAEQVPVHFTHRYADPGVHDVQLEIHAYPSSEGLSLVYHDIGEQGRLEEQLRQSQKMEAVGQLAGGVAHDFNNMLTVITSYGQLLQEDLPVEDAGRRESVGEIVRAANRAATLTRQLLAFSRRQMLQPRLLDVNTSVVEMENMLRRLIGPEVEIRTRLEPALGSVMADPGQVEQVVMNLAVNARDAMPEGGTLTIETANIDLDERYARLHGVAAHEARGPYVVVSVSDTGIGMSEITQGRIFEPFYTTKDKGKGTGLGLSTVYGIVRQSGGYVWCYSALGEGTTFKVYLPRVDGAATSDAVMMPSSRATGGTETILLVEDDEAVRHVAVRVLARAGYAVIEAADGEAALRACMETRGPIHLVITDMLMPLMGGKELAQQIRLRYPEARILFMSGYTEDAARQRRFLEAGEAFIEKPFAPDAFVRKIRETIDRRAGAAGYQPPARGVTTS